MSKTAKSKPKSIDYRELKRRIGEGEVASVYIFFGNQQELINDALAQLRASLLGREPDLNFSLFRGGETTLEEILEAAETYPMFSPRRLCVVKEAQSLKGNDLAPLESYTGSPCPTTCLVLAFDERPKLDITPGSGATFVEFSLETKELGQVLDEEARELGISLDPDAAGLLVSYVGDNVESLRNELQKLALYLDRGERVTPELIDRLTEKTRFQSVFELVNAISNRDKEKALGCLLELEAKREEPLWVLHTISWRVRLLWRAKELIEKSASDKEMARALRVSPGALYYIRRQEKNFTYEDLRRILTRLGEGDRGLKTSYVPREHALTGLVLDLCG